MLNNIRSFGLIILSSLMITVALANIQPVWAAGCKTSTFGIPHWYRGLVEPTDESCPIKPVGGSGMKLTDFIMIIIINIGDMIARFIGLASSFFIIFAGFKYVLAQGEDARIASAKKTLKNAIIGLIISISAVLIINIIFGVFGQ